MKKLKLVDFINQFDKIESHYKDVTEKEDNVDRELSGWYHVVEGINVKRKNLIYLVLLFINFVAVSQTINYTESTAIIENPERGLQKYSINISGSLLSPATSFSYNQLSQSTLTNWRTSTDRVTVVYRYFILPSGALTSTYITNMQTDFDRIRNAGLKVIIRFAYTNDCDSNCYSGTNLQQPAKSQILSHISQLSNVVNLNKDVVMSIQAGFIGTWGEWYYTSSTEFGHAGTISNVQWANRKEVVDSMLANFHIDIPLQLRYANAKRIMYGNSVPTNFGGDRIGFYNDAFLNYYADMGTYSVSGQFTNPVGSSDYTFISNTSRYLPMTGETNGSNPPRTSGSNAITEMNNLNFTTLNRDYHIPTWNNWIASNHYETIIKNLGYRLVLRSSSIIGNQLTLNVDNVGYANILYEKKLYLVFKRGTVYTKRLINFDIRELNKGTNSFTITIPNDLPNDTYELLLHIADNNLENNLGYSIQFANVGLWDNVNGYNILNQNITLATCNLTSTWNGTSWVGGFPSQTRNAVINGNYDTSINGSFDCCNLTVNGSLVVKSGDFVTVQNHIENLGSLIVESGGKLIPINDSSTSNGNISVQRRTTQMKRYDYTYLSSSVNTTISQALGAWQNNYTFEFITENFLDTKTHLNGVFQSDDPDGQDDEAPFAWTLSSQTDSMVAGKGYASMIKSIPNSPPYPRGELVTFTGDLNTGVIVYPLKLSGNSSSNIDDFNLVGNPYSSSIKANDFINENLANISGTLAYWTHTGSFLTTYPGLQANNFSTSDYAYYNLLGGTATSGTIGTTATFTSKIPTSAIGSGQGFLVEAQTENDLIFRPSFMDKVIDNTTSVVFFRTSQDSIKRVWLNLTTELGLFSQQLIGYSSETTKNYQKGWDYIDSSPRKAIKFYSLDDSDNLNKIQSRGEFDVNDVVGLGYFTAVAETFTISLDSIQGIQNVYVKDNGVLHSLPHTFTSEVGEFNGRFQLVYQEPLKVVEVKEDLFYAYPNPVRDVLYLETNDIRVKVYDVLGRSIKVKQDGNTIYFGNLTKGVYFVKLKTRTIKIIKD